MSDHVTSTPTSSAVSSSHPDQASAAIEALITKWADTIHKAATRYGIGGPDADELKQDVRLRLWRLLERSGSDLGAVSAGYVYRAAISAAIDMIRRRRDAYRELPLDDVASLLIDRGAVVVNEVELLDAIEHAILAIPATRRPAVRLHLSGRHLDEIATVMGWSPARARNLLYRGLADLRQNLREAYGER